MATKARSVPSGRPPRPALAPAGPTGPTRVGLAGYFRGVWEELKKVVWPARDELARMTGIVLATVILFAVIIGGADYVLSLGVHQALTSASNTQSGATPLPNVVPTSLPSTTTPLATPLP